MTLLNHHWNKFHFRDVLFYSVFECYTCPGYAVLSLYDLRALYCVSAVGSPHRPSSACFEFSHFVFPVGDFFKVGTTFFPLQSSFSFLLVFYFHSFFLSIKNCFCYFLSSELQSRRFYNFLEDMKCCDWHVFSFLEVNLSKITFFLFLNCHMFFFFLFLFCWHPCSSFFWVRLLSLV